MEPRQPKPGTEPPQVEGGEKDRPTPQPQHEAPGGMIGEGGGEPGDSNREGGMLGQG